MSRRYAKRSENITRNKMIVTMWQDHPEKTMRQIAGTFNVSYGTVHRAIHQHLEYGCDPIYMLISEANSQMGDRYTQQTVTRTWMIVRRWYPECQTVGQLRQLTFGADMANNPPISAACEELIDRAIGIAKKHPMLKIGRQ